MPAGITLPELKASSFSWESRCSGVRNNFKSGAISKIINYSIEHLNLLSHCKYLPVSSLRIHWRPSTILKTSKNVYTVMFFICKSIYILKVYSVHSTLRQNINVKKNPVGQNKCYKKCTRFSFASSNSSQFYF